MSLKNIQKKTLYNMPATFILVLMLLSINVLAEINNNTNVDLSSLTVEQQNAINNIQSKINLPAQRQAAAQRFRQMYIPTLQNPSSPSHSSTPSSATVNSASTTKTESKTTSASSASITTSIANDANNAIQSNKNEKNDNVIQNQNQSDVSDGAITQNQETALAQTSQNTQRTIQSADDIPKKTGETTIIAIIMTVNIIGILSISYFLLKGNGEKK